MTDFIQPKKSATKKKKDTRKKNLSFYKQLYTQRQLRESCRIKNEKNFQKIPPKRRRRPEEKRQDEINRRIRIIAMTLIKNTLKVCFFFRLPRE